MKDERNVVAGSVEERLPAGKYRVILEDGQEIMCHLAGKLEFNRVRVLIGDRVLVKRDPYGGKATDRIVRRVL